ARRSLMRELAKRIGGAREEYERDARYGQYFPNAASTLANDSRALLAMEKIQASSVVALASARSVSARGPDEAILIDDDGTPQGGREKVGGIDVSQIENDLQTRGGLQERNWLVNPSLLENLEIEGFAPVILNILPVNNFPMMLGLSSLDFPQKQKPL
ncbi:MAG: hypothetical protein NUV91_01280, partial [Candidatus Omnitrophica bacterium]|nr:hypothetical protein [Candidatus Omnitrophota bacterium]